MILEYAPGGIKINVTLFINNPILGELFRHLMAEEGFSEERTAKWVELDEYCSFILIFGSYRRIFIIFFSLVISKT